MPWRGGQKLERQTSIKDPQIGHAGSMKESCMALYRLTASLSTYGYVWKWSIPIEPEGFWSWQQTPNINGGTFWTWGFCRENIRIPRKSMGMFFSNLWEHDGLPELDRWKYHRVEPGPRLSENPACPPKPLYVWRGHKKFSGRTSFKKHGCLLVCFKNKTCFSRG